MTMTVVAHHGRSVVAEVRNGTRRIGRISVTANVDLDIETTPWLAAGVPLAMYSDVPLHLRGDVDGTLLQSAPAITRFLSNWHPSLHEVPVTADSTPAPRTPAPGVGCFFSGGVDSFYTVLARRSDITHLVFVHGFDIDIDEADVADRALRANREIAEQLGIQLVELTTDIRRISDRYTDWGVEYHGAALALVGLLLAPILGEILIPASWNVDDLRPWGSHPILDPLWSSNSVRFVHHGAEVRRPRKVALIAQSPVAMEHLRVCWQNRDGSYNCGRCEKCVRTILNFRAVGAQGRCRTLPADIDTRFLRRMRFDRNSQTHARENLNEMRCLADPDRELEAALVKAIRRGEIYGPIGTMRTRARKMLVRIARR